MHRFALSITALGWLVALFSLSDVHASSYTARDDNNDNNPPLAYRVSHAPDAAVNGIYLCQNPRLCKQYTEGEDAFVFRLYRTTVFVGKTKQSRWYIEELHTNSSVGKKRYGAIELSPSPLRLKAWKRLRDIEGSEEVSEMTLTPLSLSCEEAHDCNNDRGEDKEDSGEKDKRTEEILHQIEGENDSAYSDSVLQRISLLQAMLHSATPAQQDMLYLAQHNLHSCYQQLLENTTSFSSHTPAHSGTHALSQPHNTAETLRALHCEALLFSRKVSRALQCFSSLSLRTHTRLLSPTLPYLSKTERDTLRRVWKHKTLAELSLSLTADGVIDTFCQSLSLSHTHTSHNALSLNDIASSLAVSPAEVSVAVFLIGRYDVWEWRVNDSDSDSASVGDNERNDVLFLNAQSLCSQDETNLRTEDSQTAQETRTDASLMSSHLPLSHSQLAHTVSSLSLFLSHYGTDALPAREEVVHKIAFFFDRFPNTRASYRAWLQRRQHIALSQSLLASLQGLGAVELAATHLSNVVRLESEREFLSLADSHNHSRSHDNSELNNEYEYERESVCDSECELCDELRCLCVKNSVRESSLVRALTVLHALSRKKETLSVLVSDSDLLSLYLSLSLQIANPVVLSHTTQTAKHAQAQAQAQTHALSDTAMYRWLYEAVALRKLSLDILTYVRSVCARSVNESENPRVCALSMEGRSAGVRGLFLEAYQGLSLWTHFRSERERAALRCSLRSDVHTHSHARTIMHEPSALEEEEKVVSVGVKNVECMIMCEEVCEEREQKSLSLLLSSSTEVTRDAVSAREYFSLIREMDDGLKHTQAEKPLLIELRDRFYTQHNKLHAAQQGNESTLMTIANEHTQAHAHSHPTTLRVGFVCYSLTRHSVGRLLSRVITHMADLQMHTDTSTRFSTQTEKKIEVYVISQVPHHHMHGKSSIHSDSASMDEITRYLQAHIHRERWIHLPVFVFGAAFNATIQRVQALRLDVAVFTDLLMQPSLRVWAHALRIATTQVLFWGHPHSSGDEEFMDFFITSRGFETDIAYSSRVSDFHEQLVSFDSLGFQLFPAEPIAEILPGNTFPNFAQSPLESDNANKSDGGGLERMEREQFLHWLCTNSFDIHGERFSCMDNNDKNNSNDNNNDDKNYSDLVWTHRVYASLQSLMKMHPLFDAALVQLLRTDTRAVIVLSRNEKQIFWQQRWQQRLLAHIQSLSLSVAEESALTQRVFFLNQLSHRVYAKVVCSVDLVLDPFPFGGGVTMCDAIAGGCSQWKKFPSTPRSNNNNDKNSSTEDDKIHNTSNNHERVKVKTSIPFVTSAALQSVHRIASGFAQTLQHPWFAVNSDLAVDASLLQAILSHDHALKDHNEVLLFGRYLQLHVNSYVRSAKEVASESHRRRFAEELPSNVSPPHSVDPYHAIYENVSMVADEWLTFFWRIKHSIE